MKYKIDFILSALNFTPSRVFITNGGKQEKRSLANNLGNGLKFVGRSG